MTMTCQAFVESVTDFMEKSLLPEDRALVEDHVRLCPGCARYLFQMRVIVKLSKGMNENPTDIRGREKFSKIYQAWIAKRRVP